MADLVKLEGEDLERAQRDFQTLTDIYCCVFAEPGDVWYGAQGRGQVSVAVCGAAWGVCSVLLGFVGELGGAAGREPHLLHANCPCFLGMWSDRGREAVPAAPVR